MRTSLQEITDWNNVKMSMDDLLKQITGLAYCITDHEGNYLEVNEAYTTFYGYEEGELLGEHFTKVVPEAYRATAAQIHDAFIEGENEMPAKWQVQRKDGKLVDVMVYAVRAKDLEGNTTKVTMIEELEAGD